MGLLGGQGFIGAKASLDPLCRFFVTQSFVLASKKPSLVQLPCAKTREFGEAEFSDCLPVSALVCVFAFATLVCQRNCVFPCKDTKAQEFGLCRILGIVMPVFCGTELRFGIEIPLIYATAECQNCKKLRFLR